MAGQTDDSKRDVTVLGLGTMGRALAGALLAGGARVTVWNRTPGREGDLVAGGAVAAASAAEAVAASRTVVVCLLDHASVHEVLDPVADRLAGRVLVELTNGSPEQAGELAGWAGRHGVELLSGGIMAVPPMIGTPAAFVLYSGSRAVFEEQRPLLDLLGESVFAGEEPGRAALQDLALLSAMYGMFGGVLHAYALAGAGGVAAGELAPLLRRWLGAMSDFVDGAAAQIDSGDHARDVVSNLAMQAAAYPGLVAVSRAHGVDPALLTPLGELMRRRVDDGHGHEDITGVVELLRTREGSR
ncbi:imine reductase family protein [Pseudonocardia humida]|uniref:NAD(P)-dependent oxidoreductase n=1 Tax=Pseudonocardia humida TaxID=2800819 RepID=A0ABT1A9L0_9PSEU|nr:NAD(P)-binding domain-containing protein [Pseudonocardia humida]MCO1659651.1 NAD(P)-dependent oxidoreductase [Pseudonocardia humida]